MYTVEIFNQHGVSIYGKPTLPMSIEKMTHYIGVMVVNDLTDGFRYEIKEVPAIEHE